MGTIEAKHHLSADLRAGAEGRGTVARAELVLARDHGLSLRDVPLAPDAMDPIANAVADVREDLGEIVDIRIGLLPATRAAAQHERNRRTRAAQSGAVSGLAGVGAQIRAELVRGTSLEQKANTRRPTAADVKAAVGKFAADEPFFYIQVMIRSVSEIPGRAEAHLRAVIAAFDVFAGANYFKATGRHVLGRRLGADFAGRSDRFDRRFYSGAFRPPRQHLVAAGEIGGLLKPATVHCTAQNVARSGGLVPAAPRHVPTYDPKGTTPHLLPLGYATAGDGTERFLGVPVVDILFGLILGKSGYGKTEMSLVQAVALAHAGHGVWFLDPHGDARRRARPYLAHPELADRMWEVDLSVRDRGAMTASWNPLSMAGRSEADAQDVIAAVVTGIASALSWGDSANRAQTILTKSVETLARLSAHLCAAGQEDLQPTLFQIRTLLIDEDWREAVIAVMPKNLRSYWTKSFPKLAGEAIPVVTNVIDRMSASDSLRAFLGSSQSTFDVRRAMDQRKIVFLCPAGTGPMDRIVSCLLVYDLFRAGLSRIDIPTEARAPFYAFLDELTSVDGAAKGYLAAIVEQLRKFGVRLMAATQMAQRLSSTTRDALLQNQSLLSTSAGEAEAAKIVTRQWGKAVENDTVVNLPRYHHVMSTVLDGATIGPFKVRGAEIGQAFGHLARPENLEQLDGAVDTNLRRRPMGEILAEAETLDDRIKDFLTKGGPTSPTSGPADPSGPGTRGSGAVRDVGDPPPAPAPSPSLPADDDGTPSNVVPIRRRDTPEPPSSPAAAQFGLGEDPR